MKLFAIAALLLATPSFAADAASTYVVREFAQNATAQDWVLEAGWAWNEGVLTHMPNSAEGLARQFAMPALTAGRLYRVDVTLNGVTQGRVTVSLGDEYDAWYSRNGSFTAFIVATTSTELLSFYATKSFDGSIAKVRVVELGDEIVPSGNVVAPGWSQDGRFFDNAGQPLAMLERPLNLVDGRIYHVQFDITRLTNGAPGRARATVTLGSREIGFSHNGSYRFALEARSGHLVFTAENPDDPTAHFDGAIALVSVREITSDPLVPTANR